MSKDAVDRAIADLDDAIRLAPDFLLAYRNRGDLLYGQGDYTGAIRDYDAVIWVSERDVRALSMRGLAKWQLGDGDGGKADIAAAMRIDAGIAVALIGRARPARSNPPSPDFTRSLRDGAESILPRTGQPNAVGAEQPVVVTRPAGQSAEHDEVQCSLIAIKVRERHPAYERIDQVPQECRDFLDVKDAFAAKPLPFQMTGSATESEIGRMIDPVLRDLASRGGPTGEGIMTSVLPPGLGDKQ